MNNNPTLLGVSREILSYLNSLNELEIDLLPRRNKYSSQERETDSVSELEKEISTCELCELSETRDKVSLGRGTKGNEEITRVMFIGSAPNELDEENGLSFAGPAGELLKSIIEKGLEISVDDCYLTNLVKCRPSDDSLTISQYNACRPFLIREINLFQPEIICVLGERASKELLISYQPLLELRNRFHDYLGIKVMPTHHPESMLLDPDLKRPAWEDIKKIKTLL